MSEVPLAMTATTGMRGAWRPGPVAAGTAAAALGAAVWLALRPHTADMAAQVFRAGVVEREGFATWNGQWYGGHHLPAYSILSPLLGGLVGAWWAGAISAVAAGWSLSRLADALAPGRRIATVAALLLAAGALAALACGRTTYLLGVAFGALALEAVIRQRSAAVWVPAALLTPLASPVAGAFLALCAVAAGGRRGLLCAALAIAPVLALSVAFPGGGEQPFSVTAWAVTAIACVVAVAVTPGGNRRVRLAAVLYLGAATAAFLVATPVGANVTRLGQLAAPALLALVLLPAGRTKAFALLLPLALAWQWWAPAVDNVRAARDRAASTSFHAPLKAKLEQLSANGSGGPARAEVIWTRSRWEAATVAPVIPLARGWERQLDSRFNGAANGPAVDEAGYRRWLDGLSVRWVAVANAPVEESARGEAELVRSGLPWLTKVWESPDWTVFELEGPKPLARAATDGSRPLVVKSLTADSVAFEALDATGPVGVTVNVRWSRHWRLDGLEGCLRPERDPATGREVRNGMTTIVVDRPGSGRLRIDAFGGGPRCD